VPCRACSHRTADPLLSSVNAATPPPRIRATSNQATADLRGTRICALISRLVFFAADLLGEGLLSLGDPAIDGGQLPRSPSGGQHLYIPSTIRSSQLAGLLGLLESYRRLDEERPHGRPSSAVALRDRVARPILIREKSHIRPTESCKAKAIERRLSSHIRTMSRAPTLYARGLASRQSCRTACKVFSSTQSPLSHGHAGSPHGRSERQWLSPTTSHLAGSSPEPMSTSAECAMYVAQRRLCDASRKC
jgi:hypothetical protein